MKVRLGYYCVGWKRDGRCVQLRAGAVRGVERWTFHHDETRNSRHTV